MDSEDRSNSNAAISALAEACEKGGSWEKLRWAKGGEERAAAGSGGFDWWAQESGEETALDVGDEPRAGESKAQAVGSQGEPKATVVDSSGGEGGAERAVARPPLGEFLAQVPAS